MAPAPAAKPKLKPENSVPVPVKARQVEPVEWSVEEVQWRYAVEYRVGNKSCEAGVGELGLAAMVAKVLDRSPHITDVVLLDRQNNTRFVVSGDGFAKLPEREE